jgi:hypothetical protein
MSTPFSINTTVGRYFYFKTASMKIRFTQKAKANMKLFLISLLSFIYTGFAHELRGALISTNEQQRQLQTVGTVIQFRLINANPDKNGQILVDKITNGSVINLSNFPANQAFNLEAVTSGSVGSVRFGYNNIASFRTESESPYAMCGDIKGIYNSCSELAIGSHTVTATPWSGERATGTSGKSASVSFTIVTNTPAPVPVPVPVPRPVPVPIIVPVPRPVPVAVPVPVPVQVPTPIEVPVPSPATTVGRVTKLRLVNASPGNIGQTIIDSLSNGVVIDLSNYPPDQVFSIEAVTSGQVASIRFGYQTEAKYSVESSLPFAMCGNTGTRYNRCDGLASIGAQTVTATPYSSSGAKGTSGTPITIIFAIIQNPTPIALPTPVTPPIALPTPVTPPIALPTPVTPPIALPTPVAAPIAPPTPTPVAAPIAPPAAGKWIVVDKNATEIIPRHEACFVMVGRKAYLLAGRYRENNAVDIYDPVLRTWSKGKAPPMEIHHTQCIAVDGKIWIPTSWTRNFPRERNTEFIFVSCRNCQSSLPYDFKWTYIHDKH